MMDGLGPLRLNKKRARRPFTIPAFTAVMASPADPEAAKKALLIAADHIRRGRPLPAVLAEWLAEGIESAMRTPARHDPGGDPPDSGRALLVALGLQANNRRPSKVRPFAVFQFMHDRFEDSYVGTSDDEIKRIVEKATKGVTGAAAEEIRKETVRKIIHADLRRHLRETNLNSVAKEAAAEFSISPATAKQIYKKKLAEMIEAEEQGNTDPRENPTLYW